MNEILAANKGKDINRLWASGDIDRINSLLFHIIRYTQDKVCVSSLSSDGSDTSLELSFLSEGGFPKDLFSYITTAIPDNSGLYIRIISDEPDCDYNKEYIFENGKWNFNKSAIDLTKKTAQPALTRYFDSQYAFTTGAYIQPVSYIGRGGNRNFGWIVTGFESDTYRDGAYIDVKDYGNFLEELMPPADDEDRKTEYIINAIQANGLQRIEPGVYKLRLQEENAALYIRQLESITQAGEIKQIESTLDEYLLDSLHFSQTIREILVDAFGRDRTDIFLTPDNTLIIGSCRANIWSVTELHGNSILPNSAEKEQQIYSPRLQILQMLTAYGTTSLELDEHFATANGYITDVGTDGFDYSHGEVGYYENLDDDVLQDLLAAVQMQIEANQKAFDKSQGL